MYIYQNVCVCVCVSVSVWIRFTYTLTYTCFLSCLNCIYDHVLFIDCFRKKRNTFQNISTEY